jgi:hypothetical protein
MHLRVTVHAGLSLGRLRKIVNRGIGQANDDFEEFCVWLLKFYFISFSFLNFEVVFESIQSRVSASVQRINSSLQ